MHSPTPKQENCTAELKEVRNAAGEVVRLECSECGWVVRYTKKKPKARFADMSNFTGAAYHPKEKTVRAAAFMDDYFGKHEYGVRFSGDPHVYKEDETRIPLDVVFVPKAESK